MEFVTFNGLDIAYDDSAKGFAAFDDDKRSCIINEVYIISINYAKKS